MKKHSSEATVEEHSSTFKIFNDSKQTIRVRTANENTPITGMDVHVIAAGEIKELPLLLDKNSIPFIKVWDNGIMLVSSIINNNDRKE